MPQPRNLSPAAYSAEGGPTGALLIHGFTGSAAETSPMGRYLAARGLAVRCPLLPGHGTDPECGEMQVIEIDSLGGDEYDYFMKNPADFMLRHHLPRNYDGLKVLSMLPKEELHRITEEELVKYYGK